MNEANEKEVESLMWQMWLAIFPNMTEENFISFDDYKKRLTQKSKPKEQTVEEQIALARMLNAAYGGEVVEAHGDL